MENRTNSAQWIIPFLFLACSIQFVCGKQFTRQISMEYNPGCPKEICSTSTGNTSINLIHVMAKNPYNNGHDIHYVWSTIGSPAVLIAYTVKSTEIKIDWAKFISDNPANSITFDPEPFYTSGMQLTHLIEFVDVNDTARLNSSAEIHMYPFHDMLWDSTSWVNSEKSDGRVNFTTEYGTNTNGSILLSFDAGKSKERISRLPFLMITSNSSAVDLALHNLSTISNHSRFGLEMMFVNSYTQKPSKFKSYRSIDDEYCPAVFTMIDVNLYGEDASNGSYCQFRPVCYVNPHRALSGQKEVQYYEFVQASILPHGILTAFYGEQDINIYGMNITFGQKKDGFYVATQFTSWTSTFGFGIPPVEKLSLAIIMIISVGLGAPVVLLIFGGIGVFIKARRKQYSRLESVKQDIIT
ncbi:Glycosylated lysosomal membrane protein B [Trichoplax sp. H2]|nr:Glycosylated lysosomal membrane protein B [Trichoplax sp. H2]|eukprot:RDD44448.1 Glycosylated lysosomal membrane protein B [Trichoplax sp. H2]